MNLVKGFVMSMLLLIALFVSIEAEASSFRTVMQVSSSSLVMKDEMTASAQTMDTLHRGAFVTVLTTTGEWAQIQSNGQVGYVKATLLKDATSTIKIASSKSGLVVKASPNKAAKTVATLQYNMIVEDFGTVGNGWSFVQYGNVTGYVASSFIGKPTERKQFIMNAAGEPVRNIASPSGAIRATIQHRMKVTVYSTVAGWSYISQGATRGYVRAKYLSNKLDANEVTYLNGILLVNKDYPLPKNYQPGVDKTANRALNQMLQAAKKAGYSLTAFSHFRSYSYQSTLYNNYVKRDGQAAADRYSARPGHSEHQSGLAFDIGEVGRESLWLTEAFGDTAAGKWLVNHAHEYGFILRFPKGKEHITGYMYESWHFRYVGTNVAQEIKAANTTLEQYLGVEK